MKYALLVVCFVLMLAPVSYAEIATLATPEVLEVPTAAKIELQSILIDVTSKRVLVTYRFLTTANKLIPVPYGGRYDREWNCADRPAQLVANCTGVNTPYPGCTGVGTGSGLDPGSTCFTDTFKYVIKAGDVGTVLGVGLRTLIWSKMKGDVLPTPGNTATFPAP